MASTHICVPGLKGVGHPQSSRNVLRKNGRGENVRGIVGERDRFFFRLELDNDPDGAEYLLASNFHGIRHLREDGGLNKVSFSTMSFTTKMERSSGLLPRVDIAHDAL